MSRPTHAQRVTAGIAFLDEKLGRDVWFPRVIQNLHRLNVALSDHCPLALATDRWYEPACQLLGLHPWHGAADRTRNLGFLGYTFGDSNNDDNVVELENTDLGALTAEWHRQLVALRELVPA